MPSASQLRLISPSVGASAAKSAGTAAAVVKMVEALGGKIVGLAFVVELSFLKGRERLGGYDIFSIVDYATEDE